MRIFITGVAGFLGSHLAEALVRAGHEVVGCDNLVGGDVGNVPVGVEWSQTDCNDFDGMRKAIRGAEVVYHCAATAYEGLSVFSPHIVTQNIVTATTGALSAALAERSIRRWVHLSSMARYGTNHTPFVEDMEPRPQDPYGIGKVCAEQLVRNLCDVHGVEYVICVPHNIYGPKQRRDPFRNVVAIFMNRILQGKAPIIYGDGQQRRCFSYVADVVDPLIKLATADVAGAIINLGPDDRFITINDLARIVIEIACRETDDDPMKFAPLFAPGRPQEVREANCSADKARRLLGYEANVSLEDGLAEMYAWMRSRGPAPFDYHLPIEIKTERTPRTWTERLM